MALTGFCFSGDCVRVVGRGRPVSARRVLTGASGAGFGLRGARVPGRVHCGACCGSSEADPLDGRPADSEIGDRGLERNVYEDAVVDSTEPGETSVPSNGPLEDRTDPAEKLPTDPVVQGTTPAENAAPVESVPSARGGDGGPDSAVELTAAVKGTVGVRGAEGLDAEASGTTASDDAPLPAADEDFFGDEGDEDVGDGDRDDRDAGVKADAEAKPDPKRQERPPRSGVATEDGRRQLNSAIAPNGSYIIVSGPKGFWGRVCSGCGAVIGEVEGATRKEAKMKTGSMKELRLKWQKLSKTTDITRKSLCTRCRLLEQGDIRAALRALDDVDPVVFKNQLRLLKGRQVMVLKVVDALDFDGSWVNSIRDLIGGNPVVIAVTKMDLIVDPDDAVGRNRLMAWINRRVSMKGIRPIASFAVSGKLGLGIDDLAEYCLETLNGRNLYVVGYANCGKSTLVNQLKAAFAARAYFVGGRGFGRKKDLERASATVSRLPGTTLKSIRIPCFKSHRHAMWDTPGIIVPRYRFAGLEDARLKMISEEPTRLSPTEMRLYPGEVVVVGDNYMQIEIVPTSGDRAGPVQVRWFSPLCNDVTKVDLNEVLTRLGRAEPDDQERKDVPRLAKEFVPSTSVRGGVDADIVVQNLGFAQLWGRYQEFAVRIYVPRGCNPTVRPSMPIPDYSRRPVEGRESDDYSVEVAGGWREISSRTDKGRAQKEQDLKQKRKDDEREEQELERILGADDDDDGDDLGDGLDEFGDDDDDDDDDDDVGTPDRARGAMKAGRAVRMTDLFGGDDEELYTPNEVESMGADDEGAESAVRKYERLRARPSGRGRRAVPDDDDDDDDDDLDVFDVLDDLDDSFSGRRGADDGLDDSADRARRAGPAGRGDRPTRSSEGSGRSAGGDSFDILADDGDDGPDDRGPDRRQPGRSSSSAGTGAGSRGTLERSRRNEPSPFDEDLESDLDDPDLMSLDDDDDGFEPGRENLNDEEAVIFDLDAYTRRTQMPDSRESYSGKGSISIDSLLDELEAPEEQEGPRRARGSAGRAAPQERTTSERSPSPRGPGGKATSGRGASEKPMSGRAPRERDPKDPIRLEDLIFGDAPDGAEDWPDSPDEPEFGTSASGDGGRARMSSSRDDGDAEDFGSGRQSGDARTPARRAPRGEGRNAGTDGAPAKGRRQGQASGSRSTAPGRRPTQGTFFDEDDTGDLFDGMDDLAGLEDEDMFGGSAGRRDSDAGGRARRQDRAPRRQARSNNRDAEDAGDWLSPSVENEGDFWSTRKQSGPSRGSGESGRSAGRGRSTPRGRSDDGGRYGDTRRSTDAGRPAYGGRSSDEGRPGDTGRSSYRGRSTDRGRPEAGAGGQRSNSRGAKGSFPRSGPQYEDEDPFFGDAAADEDLLGDLDSGERRGRPRARGDRDGTGARADRSRRSGGGVSDPIFGDLGEEDDDADLFGDLDDRGTRPRTGQRQPRGSSRGRPGKVPKPPIGDLGGDDGDLFGDLDDDQGDFFGDLDDRDSRPRTGPPQGRRPAKGPPGKGTDPLSEDLDADEFDLSGDLDAGNKRERRTRREAGGLSRESTSQARGRRPSGGSFFDEIDGDSEAKQPRARSGRDVTKPGSPLSDDEGDDWFLQDQIPDRPTGRGTSGKGTPGKGTPGKGSGPKPSTNTDEDDFISSFFD